MSKEATRPYGSNTTSGEEGRKWSYGRCKTKLRGAKGNSLWARIMCFQFKVTVVYLMV